MPKRSSGKNSHYRRPQNVKQKCPEFITKIWKKIEYEIIIKTIKAQELTLSQATQDKTKCPAFIMELKNRIWTMLHDWTNEYLHNCEHS